MIAPALAVAAVVALPPQGTDVIAGYGRTTVWVQGQSVYARTGTVTRRLPGVKPMGAIDLGPTAGGRGVQAVFSRCRPNCDLYRLVLPAGREQRLTRLSSSAKEGAPSVWGDRVAFTRGDRILIGSITRGAPRAARRGLDALDELELTGRGLATIGLEDTGEGNGTNVVRLGRRALARGVIGEGCGTGFGGLQAERGDRLFFQSAQRCGCAKPSYEQVVWNLRVPERTDAATAPLAQRYLRPAAPETPESEGCNDELS